MVGLKTLKMKTINIDGVEYSLTPVKKETYRVLEQHLKFEVYPKDLGQHNWEDAKKICEDLGDGWRLPTREELHVMWLNRESVGGFAAASYWSSSEANSFYAWPQVFDVGFQYYDDRSNTYYVRAVRDVK